VSRHGLSGRLRPTRQQELLLQCSFGAPDKAIEAWRRVAPELDFERLDAGSHSLLPLVYRSLQEAAADEPLLPRLKGIYKKAWFVNHLLLDRARAPLAALRDAGIDPLLLHGGALLATYYPDPALRRVARLDVAVRRDAEDTARRALGRARWARHPDSASLESGRPLALVDGSGHVLFLHRRLPDGLGAPCAPGATEGEVWARARALPVGDVQALRLDPVDELLCACAAGPDTDIVTGVQWLADAAVILDAAAAELDWPRLVESARSRHVTPRVRPALAYLSDVLGSPVPDDVLAELARERVGARERAAHRLYSRPVGRLGGLPGTLGLHLRETGDVGLLSSLGRLPGFLSQTWELDGARQLPRVLSRKALATVRFHSAR
jgi:hypothetical protein